MGDSFGKETLLGIGIIFVTIIFQIIILLSTQILVDEMGLDVIKSASRNLEILGEGYASSVDLQKMSEKHWAIDTVTEVNREVSTEIIKRLRGAMLYPGRDILDRKLCSEKDLDKICKLALGYEKSSSEWLQLLDKSIIDQLINSFLSFQSDLS